MLTSQTTSQWVADLSNLLFDLLSVALEGSTHLSGYRHAECTSEAIQTKRTMLTSLRPKVRLNGIHKILSLLLLERFSPYAESYIPASQAGFCKGCSVLTSSFKASALLYYNHVCMMCIFYVWT